MWRYEVAWISEEGFYMWKGFGQVEKFERFLRKLVRQGVEIYDITDMDGREEENRIRKTYGIA